MSDVSGTLARPWTTIDAGASPADTVTRLASVIAPLLAEEEGLRIVVIGLPRRLDGTPNDQTARTQAIAEALGARLPVPIALQDERLSSHEADSRLAASERDWRRRKAKLDAASAAVILQDYLDRASADRS